MNLLIEMETFAHVLVPFGTLNLFKKQMVTFEKSVLSHIKTLVCLKTGIKLTKTILSVNEIVFLLLLQNVSQKKNIPIVWQKSIYCLIAQWGNGKLNRSETLF